MGFNLFKKISNVGNQTNNLFKKASNGADNLMKKADNLANKGAAVVEQVSRQTANVLEKAAPYAGIVGGIAGSMLGSVIGQPELGVATSKLATQITTSGAQLARKVQDGSSTVRGMTAGNKGNAIMNMAQASPYLSDATKSNMANA